MNNNFNEETIDVNTNDVTSTSCEIEYTSKHYLNAIIIYFAVMYIGASVVQSLLMGVYKLIYDLPISYTDTNGVIQFYPHFMDFINLWTQILVYALIFVVLFFMLKKVFLSDINRSKSDMKNTFKQAGLGILYVYAASYACNIVLSLLQITEDSENQDAIVSMLSSPNVLAIILYIVVLVVLAPIVEELIFRKAMFGYMKKYNLSEKKKILISGIIFGGIHVATAILSMILEQAGIIEIGTEIILGIPYCVMGVVLGYIYSKSEENVIVPTLVHMFNNALSVISIFLLMNMQ